MFNASVYKDLIREFSKADAHKIFGFTSGHVGAVPISDKDIAYLLEKSVGSAAMAFALLAIIEVGEFIFNLLVPIRSFGLITRTTLRKLSNRKQTFLQSITVISLGDQPINKDAYFGILLKHINEQFNYVKIVGGSVFKGRDYLFVESCLMYKGLLKLFLMAVFSPLVYICYLVATTRNITGLKHQILFMILGLKEINNGTVFSNKIIVESLAAHSKNDRIKKLLFTMEGRNWEKNMIRSTSKNKIYSIGYLHCALTPRHLSLTDSEFYKDEELPSVIIAPGEMAYKLLDKTFPGVSVKKGFFLRGIQANDEISKKQAGVLLFALTGNAAESERIMGYVAGLDLQKDYILVIRLNPNTSTYQHLADFARKLNLHLYMPDDNTLPEICFFRSSSVALDYLKSDVIPVYLSLNEIISNNIFELDNKYQFESIQLDQEFNSNMDLLISSIGQHELNGAEAANYYLDQRYDINQLSALLN